MKPLFEYSNDGNNVSFNWPEIITCASLLLPGVQFGTPGMDNTASWQWQTLQAKIHTITLCRHLLDAYHKGRRDECNNVKTLPEVPIHRPQDGKVFARFESYLNEQGIGWTACYLPGEKRT